MAYTDVDTALKAVRAAGDLYGRIEAAMARRAITRITQILATDDQREWSVCVAVIDGTYPTSWIRIVMSLLDTASQLASPTDAQLDTQLATAFSRFISTRKVG